MASYQLTRDIGFQWEYSNIGSWVLSEALAARAGLDFESLVRARVLAPLKVANTDFALSSKMKANLAGGHDSALHHRPIFPRFPSIPLCQRPAVSIRRPTIS